MSIIYTREVTLSNGGILTFKIDDTYSADESYITTLQWTSRSVVNGHDNRISTPYYANHNLNHNGGRTALFFNEAATGTDTNSYHCVDANENWNNTQIACNYYYESTGNFAGNYADCCYTYAREITVTQETVISTNIPIFDNLEEARAYIQYGGNYINKALNYKYPYIKGEKYYTNNSNLLRRRLFSYTVDIDYTPFFEYTIHDGYADITKFKGANWIDAFHNYNVYIPNELEDYPVSLSYNANSSTPYANYFFNGFQQYNFSVQFADGIKFYANSSPSVYEDTITRLFAYPNFNTNVVLPSGIREATQLFQSPNTRIIPKSNWNAHITIPSGLWSASHMLADLPYYSQDTYFPDTVKIYTYTFHNCHNFNANVRLANDSECWLTFENCFNFNYPITLPTNSVLNSLFHNCYNLNQSFDVPKSIKTSSGYYNSVYGLFKNCRNLNSPIYLNEEISCTENLFAGCSNFNQPIVFPDSPEMNFSYDDRGYPWSNAYIGTGYGLQCINMFKNCYAFNQPVITGNSAVDLGSTFCNCNNLSSPIVLGRRACLFDVNTFYGTKVHDVTFLNQRMRWKHMSSLQTIFGPNYYLIEQGEPMEIDETTHEIVSLGTPMFSLNFTKPTTFLYGSSKPLTEVDAFTFLNNQEHFANFFGPVYANGIRSFTLTDYGDEDQLIGYYKETPEATNKYSVVINFI